MPYSLNDNHRQPRRDRPHGPSDERRSGAQSRGRKGSRKRPHRPQGSDPLRGSQYKSNHNYRSLTGHDTGYNLRRGGLGSSFSGGLAPRGIDRRTAFLLGAGILIIVMLFIVISSCTRSCSAQQAEEEVKSQAESRPSSTATTSSPGSPRTRASTPTSACPSSPCARARR